MKNFQLAVHGVFARQTEKGMFPARQTKVVLHAPSTWPARPVPGLFRADNRRRRRLASESFFLWTLLVGCLASVAPASATQVFAGGKLGWTRTDLVGKNDADLSAKNNFVIGVIWDWQINPWFAVHSGVEVTQKGAEVDNYQAGVFASSVRFTYVDIPVLAKFKRPQSSDIRGGLFGTVGPAFEVNTHTSADHAGASTNIEQEAHAFDLGVVLGAGYDIPSGPGVTTIEVRYVIGLLDVFKDTAPQQDVTGDLKNRALQITIGYVQAIF